MMIRSVNINGDWNFGNGTGSYCTGLAAVTQLLSSRIQLWLGECFFATDQGIDWSNLLGSKNQIGLQLALSACILNTPSITAINQLSVTVDTNRKFSIVYNVQSSYGTISNVITPTFV